MAGNKEFQSLLNQYNTVVARCKDLEEQMRTKQVQWEKREEQFKYTEKNMRELCEDILAKDSKEMVLGTDYSWSSIPIDQLIVKSKNAFRAYVASRTDFMRKLTDQLEERRMKIEGLQDQIAAMKVSPTKVSISQDELEREVKKEREQKQAMNSQPPLPPSGTKTQILMEENDDEDDIESSVYEQIASKNATLKTTPNAIPVSENRKIIEKKKKRKEQAMLSHMVDLKDYEKKMNELSWLIMDVIGTSGFSKYVDIESEIFKKDSTYSNSKIRTSIMNLFQIGLLNKENIKIPTGALTVYQLTDMGSRLYKAHFGKTPVLSEMDQIMAEHDNCIHGYSIKYVTELMEKSGYYTSVSDRNRKHPIKISEGVNYIPDIICTDKNGVKSYFEYECVHHTQTNFNAKCNKMCKVTNVLNFIVPNRAAVEKIMKEIEAWIDNRGPKSLNNVTIRINSAVQIEDKNLQKNTNWKVVYEPGKKKEPYINF